MNIIVFGAAGDVGSRIVNEATSRGHRVTTVVRSQGQASALNPSASPLVRDVASATDLTEIIAQHDLVTSAIRPPDGHEDLLVTLTALIVDASNASKTRFIVVGGAACLLVPDTQGHTVLTAPDFLPEAVVPIATACQRQYEWCLNRLSPFGSYACPPAMLLPGKRTGNYRLGSDTLVTDQEGISQISMEDFAVALIDEAQSPAHQGARFTVAY